jgi:threonine/homoserine/homoserine lactone efflux protein
MLRHPRRSFLPETGSGGNGRHKAFITGVLTNLLNPKVGVFYVSFLPQFVPQGVPVAPYILLLGAIHAFLGLIWFVCLIAATRPIAQFLKRPSVVQTCDRLTGGMFVAFGVGLALQSRRT